MKKLKITITALLILLTASCGAVPETQAERQLFAMDTVISVKAYGADS